eukprot:3423114-Lingulodinium_polyedra.AAC.1
MGCGPHPTLVQMVRLLVAMVSDDGYSLDFAHVAAHAGNPWNEMADWLCSAQADYLDDARPQLPEARRAWSCPRDR